jgi:steroid delta-isomerase-like uncharacterized protein
MSEENKALIRRWFEEVWNKGRSEAIGEMLSEDALLHGLSDNEDKPLRGPAEFLPFHQTFRGAFPDINVVVEDTLAEGDMVVARCTVQGRHSGDHLGVAATQAPVRFTGIGIGRIRDGKIVEAWNNFDFLTMNRQIGVK